MLVEINYTILQGISTIIREVDILPGDKLTITPNQIKLKGINERAVVVATLYNNSDGELWLTDKGE